jgi:hypothetical protein
VPWLRRLADDLSQGRPEFASGSVHVGCVMEKGALGQVSLRALRLSRPYHFTVAIHTHISPGDELLVAAVQRHRLTPSILTGRFKSVNYKKNW